MFNQNDKKELILAQERKFAAQLGRHVLSKPKLHTWMILIPSQKTGRCGMIPISPGTKAFAQDR